MKDLIKVNMCAKFDEYRTTINVMTRENVPTPAPLYSASLRQYPILCAVSSVGPDGLEPT